MREVRTEIRIDAPADEVFRIVTDLDRYGEWNPLIVSARGRLAVGEKLDILIRLRGKPDLPYVVKILHIREGREFTWIGRMKLPGILDGTHRFELFPDGQDRCRLVQREAFRGMLVPFVWRSFLDSRMREGFEAANRQLKAYAEGRSRPPAA